MGGLDPNLPVKAALSEIRPEPLSENSLEQLQRLAPTARLMYERDRAIESAYGAVPDSEI